MGIMSGEESQPVPQGRRCFVSNLAWRTSWQDLKDHFKSCGNVVFANVMQDTSGAPGFRKCRCTRLGPCTSCHKHYISIQVDQKAGVSSSLRRQNRCARAGRSHCSDHALPLHTATSQCCMGHLGSHMLSNECQRDLLKSGLHFSGRAAFYRC